MKGVAQFGVADHKLKNSLFCVWHSQKNCATPESGRGYRWLRRRGSEEGEERERGYSRVERPPDERSAGAARQGMSEVLGMRERAKTLFTEGERARMSKTERRPRGGRGSGWAWVSDTELLCQIAAVDVVIYGFL